MSGPGQEAGWCRARARRLGGVGLVLETDVCWTGGDCWYSRSVYAGLGATAVTRGRRMPDWGQLGHRAARDGRGGCGADHATALEFDQSAAECFLMLGEQVLAVLWL